MITVLAITLHSMLVMSQAAAASPLRLLRQLAIRTVCGHVTFAHGWLWQQISGTSRVRCLSLSLGASMTNRGCSNFPYKPAVWSCIHLLVRGMTCMLCTLGMLSLRLSRLTRLMGSAMCMLSTLGLRVTKALLVPWHVGSRGSLSNGQWLNHSLTRLM